MGSGLYTGRTRDDSIIAAADYSGSDIHELSDPMAAFAAATPAPFGRADPGSVSRRHRKRFYWIASGRHAR